MQTRLHPATRRLAWLMVVVGVGVTVLSGIALLSNADSGIVLPFTKSALDAGWLFIFGLAWLVTGILALWWLRPTTGEPDYEARLIALEKAVQKISTRLEAWQAAPNSPDQLHKLDLELDGFGTTLQDTNRRLDELSDVNTRLDDLASQLDALYVTVDDAHRRIDQIAQPD